MPNDLPAFWAKVKVLRKFFLPCQLRFMHTAQCTHCAPVTENAGTHFYGQSWVLKDPPVVGRITKSRWKKTTKSCFEEQTHARPARYRDILRCILHHCRCKFAKLLCEINSTEILHRPKTETHTRRLYVLRAASVCEYHLVTLHCNIIPPPGNFTRGQEKDWLCYSNYNHRDTHTHTHTHTQ